MKSAFLELFRLSYGDMSIKGFFFSIFKFVIVTFSIQASTLCAEYISLRRLWLSSVMNLISFVE